MGISYADQRICILIVVERPVDILTSLLAVKVISLFEIVSCSYCDLAFCTVFASVLQCTFSSNERSQISDRMVDTSVAFLNRK